MNVLRARPSVTFHRIAPAGFRILGALDAVTQVCYTDLEITSGTDSHGLQDPHASGEAYDVSVKGLPDTTVLAIHAFLTARLGPLFTVLYEVPTAPADPALRDIAYVNPKATGPHLHIQRKKGTAFPPVTWTPLTAA